MQLHDAFTVVFMLEVGFQEPQELPSQVFFGGKLSPLEYMNLCLLWSVQSLLVDLCEELDCTDRTVNCRKKIVKSRQEIPVASHRVDLMTQVRLPEVDVACLETLLHGGYLSWVIWIL